MKDNDSARCISVCAYFVFPFQTRLACVSQPKTLVASEGYGMVISTSTCVNGLPRRLMGWDGVRG